MELFRLSLEIGKGAYTLEECRKIVRNNAGMIESALSSTFTPEFIGNNGRDAFRTLDSCKALLVRRLSSERRWAALGVPDVDLIVGLTGNELETDNFLIQHPRLGICSLYLAADGQTWCIFARSAKSRNSVEYHATRIVDKDSAPEFYRRLQDYVRSLRSGRPDFANQAELLGTLGTAILPALLKLGIRDQLIFIPHRMLHLLPLHCMFAQFERNCVYLDTIVSSISYASSVFEMYSPRMLVGPKGNAGKEARMLAAFDFSSAELKWLEPERLYYQGLAKLGLPVDIVVAEQDLPEDFSNYIWISWGGHAKSDPANWGGSYLAFGQTRHSAIKIAREWACSFKPWVLLAACESAIDSAEVGQIDEYCGLDMAFFLAGAWGTFATMWPVSDELAALSDILLIDAIVLKRMPPSVALNNLQRGLRTGSWLLLADKRKPFRRKNRLPDEIYDSVRMLRQLNDRAFISIKDWGVFRSYGVSS